MTNKIITIKSGISPDSLQFQTYYQNLKNAGIKTFYLDRALEENSEVLTNPISFKDEDYNDYLVEDISFFWCEQEIIGHQIITMEKKQNKIFLGNNKTNHLDRMYIENPGHRRKVSRLEYYCEAESIDILRYYHNRMDGKLESEVLIPYEKQIKIQK